jgi:hypothetical protein
MQEKFNVLKELGSNDRAQSAVIIRESKTAFRRRTSLDCDIDLLEASVGQGDTDCN